LINYGHKTDPQAHLKKEGEQERRNLNDTGDDVDQMIQRSNRFDVKAKVDQTQNGQQCRQSKPQDGQDTPGDIPVLALLDDLHLDGCQEEENDAWNIDEDSLCSKLYNPFDRYLRFIVIEYCCLSLNVTSLLVALL
jgi:hypothetical protein